MVSKSADILSAFRATQEKIQQTCKDLGRSADEVTLICASKTQSAENIRLLASAGHFDFGENYAQELAQKAAELKDLPIHWHYIGRLQSNKIKLIVQAAHQIHTLENRKHAELIAKCAKEAGKTPFPVFLSVSAEGEAQKSGLPWEELLPTYSFIKTQLPELKVMGIMALPPSTYVDPTAGKVTVPPLYLKLKETSRGIGAGGLSLGMSGDMKIALAAGTTCIRIGTAIFGERK